MAAMVNMSNLLNGKDSRWLQLEVCREFQRNKCSRPDTECKFAHPPANVEVQNGRVTACYDSIKGRCNREKPPCKYFHPPQHLKDQLLINGRNHLALKNALMQQMGMAPNGQPIISSQMQPMDIQNGNNQQSIGISYTVGSQPIMAANPYMTGVPTSNPYNPYFAPGQLVQLGPDPSSQATVASPLSGHCVPQPVPMPQQQKLPRSDRIEVCREFMRGACKRAESECRFAHPKECVTTDDGLVTVCMDAVKGRCTRAPCRYFHPPLHLQAQIKAAQSRANNIANAPIMYVADDPCSITSAAVASARETSKFPSTCPCSASSTTCFATATNTFSTSTAAGIFAINRTRDGWNCNNKRKADRADMLQVMDMKSMGSLYYENFTFPGMVPYKRPAADKSGIPVYQPSATTYQQLMQMQQPFVPVSYIYKLQDFQCGK